MTAAPDNVIDPWREYNERFVPRHLWDNPPKKKRGYVWSGPTIKGLHIKSPRSPELEVEAKALHAELCAIVDDIGVEDPKVIDQRIEAFNRKMEASRPTALS